MSTRPLIRHAVLCTVVASTPFIAGCSDTPQAAQEPSHQLAPVVPPRPDDRGSISRDSIERRQLHRQSRPRSRPRR